MARSGVSLEGALDQVVNSNRVVVFNRVENSVRARRQNGWINAKENVPADRNYSRRSSVASSAWLNVRNGPVKAAKTQTSRE